MNSLSPIDLYFLIIHTLYHTEGSEAKKVKEIMGELQGRPFNDSNLCASNLMKEGLLSVNNYNWRTSTYDYRVPDHQLARLMIMLYENCPKQVVEVMETTGGRLQPNSVQKTLWRFISSDFTQLDIEHFNDYEMSERPDVLMPIFDDWRFSPLLSLLSPDRFVDIFRRTITTHLNNGTTIHSDIVRRMVERRHKEYIGNEQERMLCLLDLYDYLATGQKPKNLLATNHNHRTIAAIHEAYCGNMQQAMEHFKKAVTMNNKNIGRFTTTNKSYLPTQIANYFFLLTAHKAATEESLKKASAMTRSNQPENLVARALYAILNHQSDASIRELLTAMSVSTPLCQDLAAIMSRYSGKEVAHSTLCDWLIIKHEGRAFFPLKDKEVEMQCDAAYGQNSMLTSIYRKQEWESVLEDLTALNNGMTPVAARKEKQIGYFLKDIHLNTVEVRQQTMLKNGSWGAGKKVATSSFVAGEVDGMTNEDKRIAKDSRQHRSYYDYEVRLDTVLKHMQGDSRLYVGRYAPHTLVELTEEVPYITIIHDTDGFSITSNVKVEDVDNSVIITHRAAASINFVRLSDTQRPYFLRLLSLGHFPNEAEEQLKAFLKNIGGKIEVNSDLIEGGSTLPMTAGSAQLILQMRPNDRDTYAVSLFVRPLSGGKIRLHPGMGDEVIIDGNDKGRTRVTRDMDKEMENYDHLIKAIIDDVSSDIITSFNDFNVICDAYDLLPLIDYAQKNPERITCEWPEGAQMKIKNRQTASGWSGAIKRTENGWFEIEGTVELDNDRVVTMAQLLELVGQSQGKYIRLGDGEFLELSGRLRKQLTQLSTIASHSKGRLVMSPFSAALIGQDTLEGELMLSEDDELKKVRERIREASTFAPEVPKALNATLRQYQKEGYQWMMRLNRWGAGALLADDMGLGKTIQTITLLLAKAEEGPALVIAPASVAPNWKTEIEKFAPSLRVTMLNFAGDRAEAIDHAKAGDVIVTTYGLLLSVSEEVTKKHWTTICLDEAHIIKNRGAKTSAVAMKLQSDNRIMLTGTPVQNHLGELWNLFQFVNPGLLGSFENFNRRFITPIEQNHDEERQQELDRLVKPFMLRRTKSKVATELPEKEEIYQHVDLSDEERIVYEAIRQNAETMLMNEVGNKVSINTLAEITRLRQCACDVRLTEKEGQPVAYDKEGSKIIALVELLQTILEGNNNHGITSTIGKAMKQMLGISSTASTADDNAVLVFSQFTSYLSLVKEALDAANIPYLYIDGSVDIKTRAKLVEKFQTGQAPVFLISLKAGGLGLNLTRANYVVHMDPWWNPAIEAQATDRAHRIGQKQHVTVYHLIASGTIEEKIQRMHERKRSLAEGILSATDASYKLTGEQLLELVH